MIKLLKRMKKREYGMVCASLVLIVAQVWLDLIQSIDTSYQGGCGRSFEDYDLFVTFAYRVLKDSFPFGVKETATSILRFVATDVNRFSAPVSGRVERERLGAAD